MAKKEQKYLVIVESPAKAKTIERYLGKNYEVVASKGHVRDLPKKKFGVSIEKGFSPEFEIMEGKQNVIDEIKKLSKGKNIFLASDMDREGEAIAWHLSQILDLPKDEPNRIIFSEITETAIKNAINTPQKIDTVKVDAQLARRVLDRVVGYKLSPLIWKIIRSNNSSAGRVQSAALKIISEKEREIFQFIPKDFFKILLLYNDYKIIITKENNKKLKMESINEAKRDEIFVYLKNKQFFVKEVKNKQLKRNPPEPFITSTLQQTAISMLGWTSKRTMQVAQQLYEGVDTENGHIAFITYMRTDSTRISDIAAKAAKDYILSNYGQEYCGNYKMKNPKNKTQDAHEAIRPTDIQMNLSQAKTLIKGDLLKLYNLVWSRFMASQSTSSSYTEKVYCITDETEKYTFEISSKKLNFDGYEIFYKSGETEKEVIIPQSGNISPVSLKSEAEQTKPPSRYTEASMVKEMETLGIGRPSTYATVLSTLYERKYVVKGEKSVLIPTISGFLVNDFLNKNFPNIVDASFTANMENELDRIETGELGYCDLMENFYSSFKINLSETEHNIVKEQSELSYQSNVKCKNCEENMVLAFGRYGIYLKCLKCKETKKVSFDCLAVTMGNKVFFNSDFSDASAVQEEKNFGKCPKCGSDLVLKKGRYGDFIACSNYPTCKFTKNIPVRGHCPKCGSEVIKLRSKKGKIFYACTNEQCKELFWYEPSDYICPECGSKLFYSYKNKSEKLFCLKDKTYYDEKEMPQK